MSIVDPQEFTSQAFDYLVVGGGTAGLAVAARLSEDPSVRVGVLEAGQYVSDEPNINVPGYLGRTMGNPAYDWGFLTVPQKDASDRLFYQARRVIMGICGRWIGLIYVYRGKVLGGSSAINFMTLVRTSAAEYDAFEALGNPGWNFSEFQRYLIKSETVHALPEETAKKYGAEVVAPAGTNGPISRSYPGWFSDLHEPLSETYKALGVQLNVDPNGGGTVGFATTSSAITPGKSTRSYSVTGYWEPYAARENLVLVTGAHVTKVVLEKKVDLVLATGVEFVHGPEGNHSKHTAKALREVVLSAGTFHSSQLLELSGIGQRNILESFGIPVQVELDGVGENLQDHIYVPTIYEITRDHETLDALQEPDVHAREWEKYEKKGEGMYASTPFAYSFLPLDVFAEAHEAQQIRAALEEAASQYPSQGEKKRYGFLKEWMSAGAGAQPQIEILHYPGFFPNPATAPTPGHRYHTIFAALPHPVSRGRSHIASGDPFAKPEVDPKYMSATADIDILAAGLRFIARLTKASPINSHIVGEVAGPSLGNEDLREYVKQKFDPLYHTTGSCSMLPREDGGVVDPQLKVYGTENLRVVDASVVPIQLSCHMQSTVYAIAEKASNRWLPGSACIHTLA